MFHIIYLKSLRCHVETDEVGADEPYILITTVNLASSVSVAGFPVPLPAYEVVKYGPFGDVDGAETHFAPGIAQPFWGLTNNPERLDNPDNVIFVVALMENDDGDPENLRGIVKGIVSGSVFGSLSFDRTNKVIKLINDVNSALGTPTGAPNFDDKVGDPQELRFSREELERAAADSPVPKDLQFRGDGGHYTLTFEAKAVPHEIFGAIFGKWAQFVGPLGDPVDVERPTFDGTGRFQPFKGGIVSWHPDMGAHAVWGLIGERWIQIGREQFGYPITDELTAPDGRGRFNHFRAVHIDGKPDASIYWSPDTGVGAIEVYGGIRNKWAELGWENSRLGYPISPEQDRPGGGRIQRFQHGSISWTLQGGAVVEP
ncbi:LGFP repeat-containing protein [Bacillus thuringiensis]|uniref:LGFP repeat-containing protein n=1 Tax=Bacillus thuringiensis TaxID=1428 RepID=UPI000BEC41C3|nr:hypothetical protein [Bacillus thuringiensis]PDZ59284.1 hypothetical protein CON29_24950 [Bacillus thuringiensis]